MSSKTKNNDNNYTKKELVDQLKVFFFAGTDTTSHLVEMMIYYTAKDQNILTEIRKQLSANQGLINSTEDIKKFKYVEAILKETLRYYGPIPINFPRISVCDHLLDGVQISKGTAVQYISAPTHFDPEYYDCPNEFRPQRWLEDQKQFDAACLTGFGMGQRSCIGQQLALIEAKIAFIEFLRRFTSIEVPADLKIHELNIKFMGPSKIICMIVLSVVIIIEFMPKLIYIIIINIFHQIYVLQKKLKISTIII